MHPIILISNNNVTLEAIVELSKPELLFKYLDSTSFSIEDHSTDTGFNYLSITLVTKSDTFSLYEEEERAYILSQFDSPKFFLIQFTDFIFFKRFIEKIASLEILVDNDFGRLLTTDDITMMQNMDDFRAEK